MNLGYIIWQDVFFGGGGGLALSRIFKAFYLFSREWRQDRKDGRRCMGTQGPEQQKKQRYQVHVTYYTKSA